MKKKLLTSLAIVLCAMTSWSQALNIGGHRAPLDMSNNIWLCSVPQALFGSDYAATVTYGEELPELTIDSVAVASGDTFNFEGIEGGKIYTVTFMIDDSLYTRGITFTWLPIVELDGTFGNSYKYGTVTISEPDSAYAEPMFAKLKWRGGATNTSTRHKRNYRIKFLDEDTAKMDRRFFGLRNDNNWILDAGQMDFLRVRNRVSTDLWLDMARRPWYADTLPNARNGSRGQMVEVILNGDYVGIYNMCEPIDRKQMKLKRYEKGDKPGTYLFHGQLWDAYKWSRTVTMSDPAPRTPGSTIWDGFEVKYPDPDDVHTVNWRTLDDAVWFGNRADMDFLLRTDSMRYYFDVPVLEDYFIFITSLQALDNESKNIYYACYDRTTHPRLTIAPWDLDVCLGQNFAPGVDLPDMVAPDRELDWISHLPMYDLFETEEYGKEIVARYRELRETVLDTENLVNRYRTAVNELENCGAAAREEKRWSYDSDLAGKALDLSAEMDYIESWIRTRMAFLDENIFIDKEYPLPNPNIPGDLNRDGEVNIGDLNILINIILGAQYDSETMQLADLNQDGETNIGDLNALINLILN